jgi:ABC-type uncharacterized transport system substrate-binding protein
MVQPHRWETSRRALERVRAFAKELVELNPDVLVARSTPTMFALKRETDAIPIVFVNMAEPVESGLVQTLARPGGNPTGFTNFDCRATPTECCPLLGKLVSSMIQASIGPWRSSIAC